jgi:hypothetical protein
MARSKGLVVLFLVGAVEAGTSRGMRRKEGAARVVDMVAGVVCHAWQRRMGMGCVSRRKRNRLHCRGEKTLVEQPVQLAAHKMTLPLVLVKKIKILHCTFYIKIDDG